MTKATSSKRRTRRRHVREKATIDHLVRAVYAKADEKGTTHPPVTASGLSVEEQVRKQWHPGLGGANLGNATTDALLSWAADSRHLAFAYNSDTSSMGAYLLDTRAPGSNLLVGSRRPHHGAPPLLFLLCGLARCLGGLRVRLLQSVCQLQLF